MNGVRAAFVTGAIFTALCGVVVFALTRDLVDGLLVAVAIVLTYALGASVGGIR